MEPTEVAKAGAVLFAVDMHRVATFYAAVLGSEAVARDEDHVRFAAAAFELVIHQIPQHIASTLEIGVPPVRRSNAAVKLVFFVPNIAQARAAAAASGGLVNPSESEWRYDGYAVCDGIDPEGNVVQFRARA
jgi:hypothetical protein